MTFSRILLLCLLTLGLTFPAMADEDFGDAPVGHAKFTDDSLGGSDDDFSADPAYDKNTFNTKEQTYWKQKVDTQRPFLEIGRELYRNGPFQPGTNVIGERNLVRPHLMVYGDFRNVFQYAKNGDNEKGEYFSILNLEVDWEITANDRIHLFFSPFEDVGVDLFGDGVDDPEFIGQFDFEPQAAFYEGDLAYLWAGLWGIEGPVHEIPFTFGRIPLIFQNGVWFEDNIDGFAVAVPAFYMNDIPLVGNVSNADWTFFAGFNEVNTAAIANSADGNAHIYGFNLFAEANGGYWEIGYGFTNDVSGGPNDFSYHNVGISFTRRYGGWLSNSTRVIANFGQDPGSGVAKTADGFAILSENVFTTWAPQNVMPYANFGFLHKNPIALAKNNGGILRNTGINFETNGQGFPSLADNGPDQLAAAFGVNLLFDGYDPFNPRITHGIYSHQLVLEYAVSHFIETGATDHAVGLRYQLPLTNALIWRNDLTYQFPDSGSDSVGVATELRWKF